MRCSDFAEDWGYAPRRITKNPLQAAPGLEKPPQDTSNLPRKGPGSPGHQKTPQESTIALQEGVIVPQESTIVPQEGVTVPLKSEMVLQRDKMISQENKPTRRTTRRTLPLPVLLYTHREILTSGITELISSCNVAIATQPYIIRLLNGRCRLT